MKTPPPTRHLLSVVLLLYLLVPRAGAQVSAGQGHQLYAGLTITGEVYSVCYVQYTTNLAPSNDWHDAGIVQLTRSPFVWVDTSAPIAERRFYRAVPPPTNFPPINNVWIPPGTFTMGSPPEEPGRTGAEGPQTHVTISRGFYMGKYEVTQSEFLAVSGRNLSRETGGNAGQLPVERVFWDEAVSYCAQLTTREQSAGRLPADWIYRLPTEAEWEYACRAGTTNAYSFADDPSRLLTDYAWVYVNSGSSTHPVGQKLPNPWGLYDMYGNVWEWCHDRWSPNLPGGSVTDPQGDPEYPTHVIRGGSWCDDDTRSAYRREEGGPDGRHSCVGFRVVVAQTQP